MPVKISSHKRIDGFIDFLDAYTVYKKFKAEFKTYQKPPLTDEESKICLANIMYFNN